MQSTDKAVSRGLQLSEILKVRKKSRNHEWPQLRVLSSVVFSPTFFYLQFSFALFFFFVEVVKSAFCVYDAKKSIRLLEKLAVEGNTTVMPFVKGRILWLCK